MMKGKRPLNLGVNIGKNTSDSSRQKPSALTE